MLLAFTKCLRKTCNRSDVVLGNLRSLKVLNLGFVEKVPGSGLLDMSKITATLLILLS